MHGSQYATSIINWRRLLVAKFFSSSHDKDQEDAWSQNPMVHKHSNFFTRKMNYGKFCLQSQFAWTNFYSTLGATCVHFDGPLTNHFICLGLWEKKAQTYNHGLESKHNWNFVFHKPRQIPYQLSFCRATCFNSFTGLDR